MADFIGPRFTLLLKASWEGAILVLLILAVQLLIGSRLNPRWRYGLWLLVMVRLALPWTVGSQLSLFNILSFRAVSASFTRHHSEQGRPGVTESRLPTTVTDQTGEAQLPIFSGKLFWPNLRRSWLAECWAVGACGILALLLATHWRLSRRIGLRRPLIDARVLNLLEDCKQQMGVRVPVTLVVIKEVGSPTLFGFVRPRLLLPAGMTQSFSLEELRYVFLHELGHIKRHDILVGWLMTLLQLLHWFNPLVWIAAHRMRVDRELACDALALSYTRQGEYQRYGETIIKLLENFGRSAWAPSLAGAVESKKQMEERIRMIAKFGKMNHRLGLVIVLFAALGLTTLTDAQPDTVSPGKDLIGTWVLSGAPGNVGAIPAAGGRVKLITDRSWSLTQADPRSGATLFHHGGTWVIEGNEYRETVDYANHNTSELLHKTFRFTTKLEGDTLTLTGVGNPWQEVWKRATPDSLKPHQADTTSLQGTWHGQEVGVNSKTPVILIVQGSKLEFHGSNTNEWYRADFLAFDTSPKQLVAVITACADRAYVDTTAYAIYDLKDSTLTLTGNEPGNPTAPANFDAAGGRKILFKHE